MDVLLIRAILEGTEESGRIDAESAPIRRRTGNSHSAARARCNELLCGRLARLVRETCLLQKDGDSVRDGQRVRIAGMLRKENS